MSGFHIAALPSSELDRIRDLAVDDFGNPLVVMVNQVEGGAPLRCCLREAEVGENYALLAWQPAARGGAYAEVGPVFVHPDACGGYPDRDTYPVGFRHRPQLLRAYDAEGRQVDNQLTDGQCAEDAIAALFARPDVAYLHSRNPLAGCYMFAITRPDLTPGTVAGKTETPGGVE